MELVRKKYEKKASRWYTILGAYTLVGVCGFVFSARDYDCQLKCVCAVTHQSLSPVIHPPKHCLCPTICLYSKVQKPQIYSQWTHIKHCIE